MGLFNKKKKQEKTNDAGWEAITNEFERLYPEQKAPKHYGTLIDWQFGGNDPLRGISIYDSGDCWHFVSYGLTELYGKESELKEQSGFGFEFTLRLKKDNYEDEERELKGICGIFQTIARATFTNGSIFRPYEFIYTGQKTGMDAKEKSNITGFITIPDVKAKPLNTPNGKMEFVELVGVTDNELQALLKKDITVKELYKKIGTDVTNYNRASVI